MQIATILLLLLAPLMRLSEALALQQGKQAGTAEGLANPLVELYRRRASQYEKDAVLAEEAAQQYAQMTQAAAGRATAATAAETRDELHRVGADVWARATYKVEQMLADDTADKAIDAGQKAAAPYEQVLQQYISRQNEYSSAGQSFAGRANQDANLARQLKAYADQRSLEGRVELAQEYSIQAKSVMKQAETYEEMAKKYNGQAWKIHAVLPRIQQGAEAARRYASWQMNPRNALPAHEVYPFTLAPPIQPHSSS
mmetsp:Transcript_44518/g.102780  ORF Transcript_44518/g.102780 Transcript_44518/m.102780 type:complete len:256 (-) Transcript_44518:80-847(-)